MNTSCKCKQPTKQQRPGGLQPLDEYVEGVICKVSDLNENEPKVFPLDKGEVLVVKQNNHISALGTTCTHYGAPLVNSVVGDGRLRCQWHGACFNLLNGDIENFPGFDSLPCYKVSINNDMVKVRAKKSELKSNKRIKPMVKRNPKDSRHFVVVGGGPAGAECVEALRQEGFEGQITLVCKENHLPYDRVKVSKEMDFDITKAQFRTDAFYKEHDIDVLKGISATSVNAEMKTVFLNNGNSLTYDKLFIATGSNARRIDNIAGDLKNVIFLRDYEDAKYTFNQLAKDKEIVVVGGGFISLETVSYCLTKVKKITVILRSELIFQPLLGPRIAEAFMKLYKENDVRFITRSDLMEVKKDENTNVTTIVLKTGKTLIADLIIFGIGTVHCTEFLQNSGIEVRSDGTIETNEFLETNNADVFAGGDIAYCPVWASNNKKFTLGNIIVALHHGKIAALNMLSRNEKLKIIPFTWTSILGREIKCVGRNDYDEIMYTGNVEEYKYVAFYLKDCEVVSVSSCDMDPVASQFAEYLDQGKKLLKEHIQKDPLGWTKEINNKLPT